ncbi:MAG TPA: hypothetical protein VFX59_14280 [Polyangiales bacterium]|nr:hypothetical protein [Polyangiales bacterium]
MNDDRGPELARFEASRSDQRALALLRGVTGVLALLGSVATLLGKLPIPAFLVALLGLVMSAVWLGRARKLWRGAGTAKLAALVIYRSGITVNDAFLPFEQVTTFEVDEERVDVKASLTNGDTLRIEPQYQGVDIYTLVRTLQHALGASRGLE